MPATSNIPIAMDQSASRDRVYDIFSRHVKDRILCIIGPIPDYIAHVLVAQLFSIGCSSTSKPINGYLGFVTVVIIFDLLMILFIKEYGIIDEDNYHISKALKEREVLVRLCLSVISFDGLNIIYLHAY